jgi:hypothetical protein
MTVLKIYFILILFLCSCSVFALKYSIYLFWVCFFAFHAKTIIVRLHKSKMLNSSMQQSIDIKDDSENETHNNNKITVSQKKIME